MALRKGNPVVVMPFQSTRMIGHNQATGLFDRRTMRHSANTPFLLPFLLPLLLMCSSGDDPFDFDDLGDGLKGLFVGNSLTWANDLPALVQTVAEANLLYGRR